MNKNIGLWVGDVLFGKYNEGPKQEHETRYSMYSPSSLKDNAERGTRNGNGRLLLIVRQSCSRRANGAAFAFGVRTINRWLACC